jgi:beta-glucanase (GH16 family)
LKSAIIALTCATALTASTLALTGAPANGASTDLAALADQGVRLTISPGIAQNGPRVADAVNAWVVGGVQVTPARKDRKITIERRTSALAPWQRVTVGRTNGSGVFRFKADGAAGATPYEFRALAAGTSTLPGVVGATETPADWQLKFEDQFRGSTLDTSKWGYRKLGVREGGRSRSASSTRTVHVRNGALHLQVMRHPTNPRYFLNAHVGTQGHFAYTYGVSAARIKFERPRGMHGGFWLQPDSRTAAYGSPSRTGAEIDVAEFFGKGYPKGGLAHFLYSYPRRNVVNKYGKVFPGAAAALRGRTDSWWSRYHVFSVDWTSSGYVFRIDGQITWRSSKAVSRRPQFLILSLLSSDWELPQLDRTSLPADMKVDWVRVWQR